MRYFVELSTMKPFVQQGRLHPIEADGRTFRDFHVDIGEVHPVDFWEDTSGYVVEL